MKFKLLLLTITLTVFSISVFAKPVADSIGVENQNGKKVILHKLDPKDNYYSIGRRYNVSPKSIIQYNNNAKMTIGTIIKVPTDRPFIQQAPVVVQKIQPVPQNPSAANNGGDGTATQYKVSAGETLYAISKRFNTSVEDIVNLNGLKSNAIHPGQILLVKSNASSTPATPSTTTAPPPSTAIRQTDSILAKRDSTTPASQDSSHHTANGNKYGLFEKDEKGVATWMDDDGLDPNKMLVLHRTAPIGTVIRITNIMTNKTVFAKVVGRFTDNEQTKDVIIVMTKNVAQSLGALDKRFQVNLSYGAPNE